MDPIRAKAMTAELAGREIEGWLVKDYIDCGKSALVLGAEKSGCDAAIKVFDRELIERFGKEVQVERIRRERALIGKKHPHLIEIFDGGYFEPLDVHFVVMNRLAGSNLAKACGTVPFEKVRTIVSQVAAASRFLEELGLAHRDIKPENIGIDPGFESAVLLDLGVIRPVGIDPITDQDALRPFIGTLQYSSPEFLLREEVDSIEGWRALTFYQLGGVLHDLIMRRRLFDEFHEPFVKLANAIQRERPRIESDQVARDLIETARHCLVKDPNLRLELVQWENFDAHPPVTPTIAATKERIAKRRKYLAGTEGLNVVGESEHARTTLAWKINEYASRVQAIFRRECIGNENFPPINVADVTSPEHHATTFFVAFDLSPRHGLNVYLKLRFQLRWLAIEDDLISLEGAAIAAPRDVAADAFIDKTEQQIYQGRFDPDSIAARLIPILYSVFEQAQVFGEDFGDKAQQLTLIPPEEVV